MYQGIPIGGYTKMIANLLDGIEVRLNTDYLADKTELDALADKVVYTGPIDAYFDYKLGTLEYRSVRFENELLDKPSFQGNAAVNYTDRETPWTRIIEHKWFAVSYTHLEGASIRLPVCRSRAMRFASFRVCPSSSTLPPVGCTTVSYTHLDVYKRQDVGIPSLRHWNSNLRL